ncbi:unnamed protein product [Caretta caretta]
MPTNKSPGMDGLTVEFYCAFWDILGPDLATVWAESLQGGVLSLSCRRAVLALLPKKGDLRDLRNWRPVSLLSTDYKIVVKAISLWLGSVMADVIHPDQTYTVPGRSIFDNLFLVRDLLELGRRDGLSFALLSLDQEKAFDRVDHGYLLSTLQAFGFGPQFVSFLRVLYAPAECLVRLNWTLTEPVSFGRGVQHGCPLSGQLYALAIEPFLCLLRRRLTGLVLWEPELRLVLSAYADDVLLVVQDPGDLARVKACQAIYSAVSSARVNWVKSSGLAVGDWRQVIPEAVGRLCDSGSDSNPGGAGPICKICFQGAEQGELLNPCRCDGSVRYTHQLCLLKWISERGSWTCELCCYRYHVIAIKMKKPCQWQSITITLVEKVQMIAVILGSLFLVASVTWLLWSAFSPYAVWQRKDILFQICYGMYGFMDLVCIGLIVHEGASVYRVFKRWRAVNLHWDVLNYDKATDIEESNRGASSPGKYWATTNKPPKAN